MIYKIAGFGFLSQVLVTLFVVCTICSLTRFMIIIQPSLILCSVEGDCIGWQLFRDRLPTKDNSFRIGIITQNSQLCPGGCSNVESINHLFLGSRFFGSLWYFVQNWLGFYSVDPSVISDQFILFGNLLGFPHGRRSLMLMFWFAYSWVGKRGTTKFFSLKEFSFTTY